MLAAIYPDKRKFESRGQPFSFEAFILYGSSLDDLSKLWRIALERETGKTLAARQEKFVQRASMSNISAEINKTSSSIMDAAHSNQKHKAIDLSEGSADDQPTTKKQRVTWTPERHNKFLEAIEILGYESKINHYFIQFLLVLYFLFIYLFYLLLFIISRCGSQENS